MWGLHFFIEEVLEPNKQWFPPLTVQFGPCPFVFNHQCCCGDRDVTITGKMMMNCGKKSNGYCTVSNFNYHENRVCLPQFENLLHIAQKSCSSPSDTDAQKTIFGRKQGGRKFSGRDFFRRRKRKSLKSGRILGITRTLRRNWS